MNIVFLAGIRWHLVPPFSSDMSLDAWMQSIKLDRYAAAIKDEGYDELEFLKDADQEDVDEMIVTIGEQLALRMIKIVRHQLLTARPFLNSKYSKEQASADCVQP